MWPFKKKAPEPALDINRNFYLSVLLGPGVRPTPLSWVNPDGSNGAVSGFAAPLNQDKNTDLLSEPIADGSYVLATKDRKTLVQADFFDLAAVPQFQLPGDAASQAMVDLSGDRLARAQSAVGLATLVFKGYSQDVYESVRFLLDCGARLADLSNGVVADPLAETYRLPSEMRQSAPLDARIDFRDVCSVKAVQQDDGVWVSTRGMAKFNLPEYEVYGVATAEATRIAEMLVLAGQEALLGSPMPVGETVSTPLGKVEVTVGGKNRNLWGDRSTTELVLR
ncbi:MAG: hypothetical protein ABIV13_00010 [Fimbriimonadales bacterium]